MFTLFGWILGVLGSIVGFIFMLSLALSCVGLFGGVIITVLALVILIAIFGTVAAWLAPIFIAIGIIVISRRMSNIREN